MDEKRGGRSNPTSDQLNLPAGFRFHPTDEELVVNYLLHKSEGRPFAIPIIAEVDLYKFDPWELPDKALFGEREWYFFSPRDRKYPNGARPNRAAASGYWKATGTDKPIQGRNKKVGVKKALVFYKGKAPKGIKTNWIMHEYRLAEPKAPMITARKKGSLRLDDWVLCRIYKKSGGAAFKVMVSPTGATAGSGLMKAEPPEELDDVLASLPDIEENDGVSRFKVPRGSYDFGSSPAVFEEMFSEESSENMSDSQHHRHHHQQSMSLMPPVSSLTHDGYYEHLCNFNNSRYQNNMVMMNKVNPWAYDNTTVATTVPSTFHQHQQQQPQQLPAQGGNRVINPPAIKLETMPSNISDILLQIQQQNAASAGKKRTQIEDDVQSTCRSPAPRPKQGFGFDLSHQMLYSS